MIFQSPIPKQWLLITLFLLINSTIQIILKKVALGSGGSDYMALFLEPLFFLCGILFVALAAVWIAVLRCMPLSKAYPYTSLTVITLMISGALFFGESITLGNLLGGVVITAGVVIIASARKDSRG